MGFDLDLEDVIGSTYDIFFSDDNMEKITTETFYTVFLYKHYIASRRMALDSVRTGLTLNKNLKTIFNMIPAKALDTIEFASDGLELDHVLEFLKPQYQKTYEQWDEETEMIRWKVIEQCHVDAQEKFFEVTLPGVLRDRYNEEKKDEETYSKKAQHQKDFLSVSLPSSFWWFFLLTCHSLSEFRVHFFTKPSLQNSARSTLLVLCFASVSYSTVPAHLSFVTQILRQTTI